MTENSEIGGKKGNANGVSPHLVKKFLNDGELSGAIEHKLDNISGTNLTGEEYRFYYGAEALNEFLVK